MDSRPIGVFDSGFGGLTVLTELKTKLPHENFIYFGDTLRVPYGNKPSEDIILYSRQISRWLVAQDVKAIIVACNTSSCIALSDLQRQFRVPIFGMIDAGVLAIVESLGHENSRIDKVGIIGTKNTVASNMHERLLRESNYAGEIISRACGLFVPTIEEGIVDNQIWDTIISYYLFDMRRQDISGILLACTHYPIIINHLERFFGQRTKILNPNTYLTSLVCKHLDENHLLNPQSFEGSLKIYITGSLASFSGFYHQFFDFGTEGITVIDISAIQ